MSSAGSASVARVDSFTPPHADTLLMISHDEPDAESFVVWDAP